MNQDPQQGGAEFGPAVPSLVSNFAADELFGSESGSGLATDSHPSAVEHINRQKWISDAAHDSPSPVHRDYLASPMSVVSFVEHRFAPEHVNLKRYPSRLFYQAILKHVISPEEVERIFGMNSLDPRKKLKALDRWPYLDQFPLSEIRHDHVSRIISAAAEQGYSAATIRHIRNVIGTLFSCAIEKRCFLGENPIRQVKPAQRLNKEGNTLTAVQAAQALAMMRHPEKEMTVIGAIAGMSPAEIFGLQWAQVNLTDEDIVQNDVRIPAMTIAVRKRWYRGQLDSVQRIAVRDLAIDTRLLSVLIGIKSNSRFAGPSDFVLVSQHGAPVNYDNLMTKRLRPIAKSLGVPSVTSRAFRQVQGVLTYEG